MNIITYNVRGLGRGVKWPTIRRRDRKKGGKKEKEGAVETGNGSVLGVVDKNFFRCEEKKKKYLKIGKRLV